VQNGLKVGLELILFAVNVPSFNWLSLSSFL